MSDILKDITDELPKVITDACFEGANIVLYTEDKELVEAYKIFKEYDGRHNY